MKRCAILSALLFLGTALAAESLAQGRGAYQVGQQVEVKHGPAWVPGKILEVIPDGWLKVQIQNPPITSVFPPSQVRPRKGGASGAGDPMSGDFPMGAGRPPQGGEFKAGEQVEAKAFGEWESAVVVGSHGPFVEVRLDSGMEVSVFPDEVRRVAGQNGGRAPAQPAGATRTWTDSTGKFKLQAIFVKREGDQITIEQANGKEVTLHFAKLSHHDQIYVTSVSPPGASGMYPGDKPSGTAGFGDGSFDGSTAKAITLTDPGTSSVTPDGVVEPDSLTEKPIVRAGKTDRRGRMERSEYIPETRAVAIHRPTARAFVSMGVDSDPTQVVCFDMKGGKEVGTLQLPLKAMVTGLSPSGKRMLAQGGRRHNVLYLWDLEGGPKQTAAWQPFSSTDSRIEMAAFLDERHVVTAGSDDTMVVWDTAEKRGAYFVPLLFSTVPAVSPGRKQIAVATKAGVFILDANDGSPLAKLPGEPEPFQHFCFRNDGRQLVAASTVRMQVWDLEKGTRIRVVRSLDGIGHGAPVWLSPGYILVGGTHLIDLERRVVLWRYQWQGLSPRGAALGGLYWTMLSDAYSGQQAFVAVKLPHPEAVEMAQQLTPDSLFAVKPGGEVTVQVKANVSAEERQIIHDGLTRRLEDNGIRVVDGSNVVLTAATAQGATQEVKYRGVGGRETGNAQVTKQVSTLTITESGKVLWKASQAMGTPVFVSRKKGESIDSAVAEKLKPTVGFFVNTPIPEYLARPGKDGAYGESMVTPQGIVPPGQQTPHGRGGMSSGVEY